MRNYTSEDLQSMMVLIGYEDFHGNTRMLYQKGSRFYKYIPEKDEMQEIENTEQRLGLFYAIIDDIKYVAYIKRAILKYLANNAYYMTHYPLKSENLMDLIMQFTVITGEVGKKESHSSEFF